MLTAEQSKKSRAHLGLSQRRTAEQANVPRSYLNQFERGRWNPTDAFLARLTAFYRNHGIVDPAGSEPSTREVSEPDPVTQDAPGDDFRVDPADSATNAPDPDAASKSGWRAVAKGALVVVVVGGFLIASGNLPAALEVIRRMPGGRPPRFPGLG